MHFDPESLLEGLFVEFGLDVEMHELMEPLEEERDIDEMTTPEVVQWFTSMIRERDPAIRDEQIEQRVQNAILREKEMLEDEAEQEGVVPLSDPDEIAQAFDVFATAHAENTLRCLVAEPIADAATSCVGTVRLSLPGETWPTFDGELARGVLQVDLRDLPEPVPVFHGIECLCIFVRHGNGLPEADDEHGGSWLIREYPDARRLVPIADPGGSPWRGIGWSARDDMAPHRRGARITSRIP